MKKHLLFATFFLSFFLLKITTAQITNSGNNFTPDTITVTVNTPVSFNLTASHDAVEVDMATWLANGTASNGGFTLPLGGGVFTPTNAQTYYYVCTPHAGMGMKGVIVAENLNNSVIVDSLIDTDPLCANEGNNPTGLLDVYLTQSMPPEWVKVTILKENSFGLFLPHAASGIANNISPNFSIPLGEGNYFVEVTDSLGVILYDSMSFTLTAPPPLTIIPAGGNVTGNFIDITVGGGTPGYNYNWNGPNGFTSNNEDISGLAPGVYEVNVTDLNNCLISKLKFTYGKSLIS